MVRGGSGWFGAVVRGWFGGGSGEVRGWCLVDIGNLFVVLLFVKKTNVFYSFIFNNNCFVLLLFFKYCFCVPGL